MKSWGGHWLWLVFTLFQGVLWTGEAAAFSVRMTYGFAPGAVYKVTEQYHDVGKTVTVMDMLGQPQKFETASDQLSSGVWTAKAVSRVGEGVKLAVEFGEHKGGQRWWAEKIQPEGVLSRSSAEVVISPLQGLVGYTVKPAGDPAVALVYKSRFAWMPVLPQGFVTKGATFSHEYQMKSGRYDIKARDDYFLVEVKGNFVTFDVKTNQTMVVTLDKGPGGAGAAQGVGPADVKLAWKGSQTAVFDIREGIFTERKGTMSYASLDSGEGAASGAAVKTTMEGVLKYSWKMEPE